MVSIKSNTTVVRIGYDLFEETDYLLMVGQPPEFANIPTLEYHISILRDIMVANDVVVLEIPPIPEGYSSIACLTHDVDFIRIGLHKFDRTMFGFLYRAVIVIIVKRFIWKE